MKVLPLPRSVRRAKVGVEQLSVLINKSSRFSILSKQGSHKNSRNSRVTQVTQKLKLMSLSC